LSNNNANIRRLKARLKSIEHAKATPADEIEVGEGIRIEQNPSANRIRIFYPGKPDAEERSALKYHGFRWSPKMKAWSGYINYRTRSWVEHMKKRETEKEAA